MVILKKENEMNNEELKKHINLTLTPYAEALYSPDTDTDHPNQADKIYWSRYIQDKKNQFCILAKEAMKSGDESEIIIACIKEIIEAKQNSLAPALGGIESDSLSPLIGQMTKSDYAKRCADTFFQCKKTFEKPIHQLIELSLQMLAIYDFQMNLMSADSVEKTLNAYMQFIDLSGKLNPPDSFPELMNNINRLFPEAQKNALPLLNTNQKLKQGEAYLTVFQNGFRLLMENIATIKEAQTSRKSVLEDSMAYLNECFLAIQQSYKNRTLRHEQIKLFVGELERIQKLPEVNAHRNNPKIKMAALIIACLIPLIGWACLAIKAHYDYQKTGFRLNLFSNKTRTAQVLEKLTEKTREMESNLTVSNT